MLLFGLILYVPVNSYGHVRTVKSSALAQLSLVLSQVVINKIERKAVNMFLPSVLTYVLGAQMNRLIETVLLSTHNICFGCKIRKSFFCFSILTIKVCTGIPIRGSRNFLQGGSRSV